MKLRYSPTSPYVRKVTVTAIEVGIDHRIERIPTNVHDPASDIGIDNPLGKVPALITDEGAVLYDSPVICEYLDGLATGRHVFPAPGPARWLALRQQALADGILDAGVLRFLELRRPEPERSAAWIERQVTKMIRGLDALEAEAASFPVAEATIGHVTVGCLIGWLDFRVAEMDWRAGRRTLAQWYEGFAQRPSMLATVPREP
jgi:glutathione S-transferase